MRSKAKTVRQYLDGLDEPRRGELGKLHSAISAAVPKLKPGIHSGMIGYGRYHYKYASGREGDGFVIGLASQKNYISVYVCAAKDGKYVAEAHKDRLGKASVGRSCIRFKRLEDVNLKVLVEL